MNLSVSVIVPTYNRAALLADALESIRSQTYPPNKVIVVDDGSTDNTREVVSRFGNAIQYLAQPNRGPGAARNLGISAARGDILAFLDDDDVWLPHALASSIARFLDTSAPTVDMVCGLAQRASDITRSADGLAYTLIPPVWAPLSFCNTCIRRQVFERVGILDESAYYGEDLDWFMRARELGVTFAFLDTVTALFRRHNGNLTLDQARTNHYFLAALRKSLARRAGQDDGAVAPIPELPDMERLKTIVYSDSQRGQSHPDE